MTLRIIASFSTTILAFITGYLMWAFMMWELSPKMWTEGTRILQMIFCGVTAIGLGLMVFASDHWAQRERERKRAAEALYRSL